MLRNVRLLYIHNFLTDFAPQWPFLVIYFTNIAGSYTTAMCVVALEVLASALFDIPMGIFSDRAGRRLTMALGSLCSALGLTCYAWASEVNALYVGAILTGLSQCLFSGNNNALLFESLQSEGLEQQYHHYRGGAGSMFQLSLCLSAFLSIWLSHFGLQTVFICGIAPQTIAILISLLFQEAVLHIQKQRKGFLIFKKACATTWKNPHLLGLALAKSISYGAGEANFKFQSVFVNALWPLWAVGLYRGMNHAISFVGFRMAGRLIERFKEPYVFISRDIYWFTTQMLALILKTFISPLMMLSGAFFFGPGEVASDHLMQKEFSNDERATMGSIASFITSLVFAIISLSIGIISDNFGVRVGLGAGVCICFLSLPVNVWLFRREF